MRIPALAGLIALTVAAQALGGCKLVWHADQAAEGQAGTQAFNAATFVEGIWASRVLPHFGNATDAAVLAEALATDPAAAGEHYGRRAGQGSPWTYSVRGEGTVTAVDTKSRRGVLAVQVGGAGAARELILQIGPVVVGTALRDSLPFISFGQFVNQLEFAQVSRSLNDRAVKDIRAGFPLETALGKTVRFAGAAIQTSVGEPIQVTPVSLELVGGAS